MHLHKAILLGQGKRDIANLGLAPNHSIEQTSSGKLRLPAAAAHVKR